MPAPAIPPPVLVVTTSPEATQDLGAALGRVAAAGDRLALLGALGAGKTQLAKGFARGVGVEDVVNSPSFTLMAEYSGWLRLFHLDLYRLSGSDEVLGGGLFDERQAEGVTLTEWAERLDAALDPDRLDVRIAIDGDERRSVELSSPGPRYARYLEAAARWAAEGRRDA